MFPIPSIASRRYGLFALCAFTAVATNVVSADSFKLYINKDQNSANVITFDDSLTAAVKHTSEGMELVLPGVEVALRCKSNGANSTTDSCVIAVEAATVSSTSTSTTSSSGSSSGTTSTTTTTSTSSNTSSGDCTTQGTWSNCDSTSSSGSTSSTGSTSTGATSTGTTSTTTTTTTTTNSAGSSSCTSSGSVVCRSEDLGSGGAYSTGNTVRVNVAKGQVHVFPFTVSPGRWSGSIGRSRTSTEVGDGAPRVWFSLEPNGEAICSAAQPASYSGASRWTQLADGSGCKLGNTKGVYYFNVTVCNASNSDRTCQSSGATPSSEDSSLYINSKKFLS